MFIELVTKRWPGILIVIAVLLPNILSIVLPPRNIPHTDVIGRQYTVIFLTIFERVGQIGVFSTAMFYTFKIHKSFDKLFIACILASLALYYICWLRFFLEGRDFSLLFSPLFFLPIPLAIFPILCFAAVSRVERSIPLLAATVIFAIGHIPLSYFEFLKSK